MRKVYLSLVTNSPKLCTEIVLPHFSGESGWLHVGDIVKSTVTMVKEYGVVTTLDGGGTGFIMNVNLLGGREYAIGATLNV